MSTEDLAREAAAWGPTALALATKQADDPITGRSLLNVDGVAEIAVRLALTAQEKAGELNPGATLGGPVSAAAVRGMIAQLSATDDVGEEIAAIFLRSLDLDGPPTQTPVRSRGGATGGAWLEILCACGACPRAATEGWPEDAPSHLGIFCQYCATARCPEDLDVCLATEAGRAEFAHRIIPGESEEPTPDSSRQVISDANLAALEFALGKFDKGATDGPFCRPRETAECGEKGPCRADRCACKACPNSKTHGWHVGDFCRPCDRANCRDGVCRVKKESRE